MIQSARTFRVFISSTFSDLKVERNALHEKVFPKLRDLCSQHGCRFQAIDLLWGVSEEAALDQQTMRICLEEIERCQKLSPRPNFIILLGDRYGWQPAPYEIPADEYEQITNFLDPDEKAFLESWYCRDDNAVPPIYDLIPREGVYENFSAWAPVEFELLRNLRKGIENICLTNNKRLKYCSSATEQEIYKGALQIPHSKEHIFCFIRKTDGLPDDKTALDYIDLDEKGLKDKDAFARLEILKEKVRKELSGNVHEYNNCQWSGSGIKTIHIDQLCKDVLEELSCIIKQEMATIQQIDFLSHEISEHQAFAEERASHFTGRKDIQEKILSYINADVRSPMFIYGEGGSGKSSLVAHIYKRITSEKKNAAVFLRFISATPSSSNIFFLLESLYNQTAKFFGLEAANYSSYRELVENFKDNFNLASGDRPIILFLDALDQLSEFENAKNLEWLPIKLPKNVKIIVTALEPSECCVDLKNILSSEQIVKLGRMDDNEGEELLNLWLIESRRTLQKQQKEEILRKFKQCGLPLYLKFAFEKVRRWKSYSCAEISGANTQEIILEFLSNLSAESHHGEVIVKHALGYMSAGKNGLNEEEMLDLLSLDPEVKDAFRRRSPNSPITHRLPLVVWSRLYHDLRPYLTERNADQTRVMIFFHRQFGEVVRNKYLDAKTNMELHRRIAGYFEKQPYQYFSDIQYVPNYRKVSELPYQWSNAEIWNKLENTLTDFNFPMAKCAAQMVNDLIADYQDAVRKPLPNPEAIKTWETFFLRYALNLRRSVPRWQAYKVLLQLALDHADESPVTVAAEKWCTETSINFPFFHKVNRPQKLSPDYRMIAIDHSVSCMVLHFDGDRLIAADKDDWDIKLFDTKNGQWLRNLGRHNGEVTQLILHADGIRVVSASEDKTIRIWNIDNFKCLSVLEGHQGNISQLLFDPEGSKVISGSSDNTIRIWDIDSFECIAVLEGYRDQINFVLIHPDGHRLISGSDDKTVRLWDIDNSKCSTVMLGHEQEVTAAFLYPDSKRLLSGSNDNTLRQWDIETGECLSIWYYRIFNGCQFMYPYPDENKIVIGEYLSRNLNIFDMETFDNLHTLEGNSGIINFVKLVPGSPIFLTSTFTRDIKFWDFRTGKCIEKYNGEGRISDQCIEVHPDGDKLVIGGHNIEVWDISANDPEEDMDKHSRSLNDLKLLGDNTTFFSGSIDGSVKFWDGKNGACLVTLKHLGFGMNCFEIHPDGRRLFTAGKYCQISIYDLMNGQHQYDLGWLRNLGTINAISISINGLLAVTGTEYGEIELWNISKTKVISMFKDGEWSINSIAFVLDDKKLISGSSDGAIRLWDIDSGMCSAILEGHEKGVNAIASHPDGHRALSASDDCTVKVWDLNSNKCLATFYGHDANIMSVAIHPEGKKFITCSLDTTIKIWDIETGKCLGTLIGHNDAVINIEIHPDGRRVLSSSLDESVKIWDLESKTCIATFESEDEIGYCMAIHPNGSNLLIGNKLLNIETMECLKTFDAYLPSDLVAFHPDGKRILSGGEDSVITLWDIESGQCIASPEGHRYEISHMIIHPGGRRLISAGVGEVKVWDIDARVCLFTFSGHDETIHGLLLTPNGANIISACGDNKLRIMNIDTGIITRTIETGAVFDITLSEDGKKLISYGNDIEFEDKDYTIKIWDLESGIQMNKLAGHEANICSIAIHPDGRMLFSVDDNGYLIIWDIDTAECLLTKKIENEKVGSLEISSDGRFMITCCENINLWGLEKMCLLASFDTVFLPVEFKLLDNGNIAYLDTANNINIISLYNDDIEINKHSLGKKTYEPNVAESLAATYECLGSMLMERDRSDTALIHFRRAVNLMEHIYSNFPESINIACSLRTAYNRIGVKVGKIGKYEEAIKFLAKGNCLQNQTFCEGQSDLAAKYSNLTLLLQNSSQMLKPELCFRRVLEIKENIALCLYGFGQALKNEYRYLEAEEHFKQSLDIREDIIGLQHEATINSKYALAKVLMEQPDKLIDAKKILLQVLDSLREPDECDMSSIATCLNRLGIIHFRLEEIDQAEELFRQAIEIREKNSPPDRKDLAQELYNLAFTLKNKGSYLEAGELFRRSLKIREVVFGHEHPVTIDTLDNLAMVLVEQPEKLSDAKEAFLKLLDIHINLNECDMPSIAKCLDHLALAHYLLEELDNAEERARQALEIRENNLPTGHVDVVQSTNNLASILKDKGKYTEAEGLYIRSLKITSEALGVEHPSTIATKKAIAELATKNG